MRFDLTTEQQLIVDTADRVGRQFGLPYWRELDDAKAFPHDAWQAVCDAGLSGIAVPESMGGSGFGMVGLALAVEALCAAGAGSTLSQLFMCNSIFGGVTLSRFGTPEMQAWLPEMIAGRMLFAMALTEPDAGTNALGLKTFAQADGGGWRLNGQKIWITAVPEAHKMLVVARTQRADEVSRKTDGISLFMIDAKRDGLSHRPIAKAGTNTLSSSMVFFDNVRAQPNELVGELHRGFRDLLDVLNTERIVTTAGLLGTSALALSLATSYAQERRVFGDRPIGSYQALQFPLAEAFIKQEAAKLLNLKAAALHDEGRPYGSEANMAKWLAGHAAGLATDRAMQTLGGMGYAKESYIERLWRDARLFRIAPVSEEMILNFVAQHDLHLPRSY